MNEKTLQENIRTLSAIIGKDEHTAVELLGVSVAIVFDEQNSTANEFAKFVHELLRRTVKDVRFNPLRPVENSVSVIIGNAVRSNTDRSIYINLAANQLIISRKKVEENPLEEVHPILLLLGACYTAAQTVKEIVGAQFPLPDAETVRIDFDPIIDASINESFDIGITYLAGAGAIGNAFLLALSLLNPSGELHIADPDIADDGNLNRCIWFNESDVGQNKAQLLEKLAQPKFENLKIVGHPVELQGVPNRDNNKWLRRLVVATDSRRVRRSLQNEIPGEVYDASTTDIREVILHFNRQPLDGLACLSCIYFQDTAESAHELHVAESLGVTLEDVQKNFISVEAAQKISERYSNISPNEIQGLAFDSLFKQLCGEGKLKTSEDKQVLAPFSFVSVLAGTYLAIEFAKRIISGNTVNDFNYWRIGVGQEPNVRAKRLRKSKTNCEFCGNEVLTKVANSLWS